jgi:hypothetical protein
LDDLSHDFEGTSTVLLHVVRVRDHRTDDAVGIDDERKPRIHPVAFEERPVGPRCSVGRSIPHDGKSCAHALRVLLCNGILVDADANDANAEAREFILGLHEAPQLLTSATDVGEKSKRDGVEREDHRVPHVVGKRDALVGFRVADPEVRR